MKLSVVTTLYNSAPHITEFYQRAKSSAQELVGEDYEIIMVNDGSPDNSIDIAVELSKACAQVVIVDLSRNFGHHKALMTGLSYATGEKIFLLDSDLEEEPEWLIRFDEQMSQQECDVVYGAQETRKGGRFERWSGRLYYILVMLITSLDFPRNITTARLMSRRYVDALLLHKEHEMVISGLWALTGFIQCPLDVKKQSISPSTYNVFTKLMHLTNTITAFSARPLQFIFYTGVIIFTISMGYALILIGNRILFSQALDGWTSLMVSIWLLGGIIISFLGLIGIYLSKVYSETKNRPYVIVKEIHRNDR